MDGERWMLGMHWPNHPHRRDAELRQLVGEAAPVTLLHMQAREVYGWLRRRGPGRLIHVRIYRQWWEEEDPRALARWAAGELGEIWDDPRVLVSPANEQNIELRRGAGWVDQVGERERRDLYARIGQWNWDFWEELDRQRPGRRALALWSALADGHDARPGVPDSEYQVPEVRAALERVDVLASHPYGKLHWEDGARTVAGGAEEYRHMLRPWRPAGTLGARDPGGLLVQLPGRAHFVSETGTFVHGDRARSGATLAALEGMVARAAGDGVTLGVTPFVWDSNREHWRNIVAGNEVLVRGLLGRARRECEVEVPVVGGGGSVGGSAGSVGGGLGGGEARELAGGYRPHVLEAGETLWGLAGARWRELYRVVPVGDERALPVGTVVMVPADLAGEG